MSQLETKQNEIAKRYGGVLFELAQERSLLKEVSKDAHRLHACLRQETRAWEFIASPVILLKTQTCVLNKIAVSLNLGKLMTQFLKIVAYHHRLHYLSFMLEDFMARCRAAIGHIEGILETATTLSPQTLKSLQKTLTQYMGKEVVLHSSINRSLLGGVVVRVGSCMIDASFKTRLHKLRRMMKG